MREREKEKEREINETSQLSLVVHTKSARKKCDKNVGQKTWAKL